MSQTETVTTYKAGPKNPTGKHLCHDGKIQAEEKTTVKLELAHLSLETVLYFTGQDCGAAVHYQPIPKASETSTPQDIEKGRVLVSLNTTVTVKHQIRTVMLKAQLLLVWRTKNQQKCCDKRVTACREPAGTKHLRSCELTAL